MKNSYGTYGVLYITLVSLVCYIPLSHMVDISEVKGKGYGIGV